MVSNKFTNQGEDEANLLNKDAKILADSGVHKKAFFSKRLVSFLQLKSHEGEETVEDVDNGD